MEPDNPNPVWRPLEGALISVVGQMILADHEGLGAIPEEVAAELHLYLVCRRPRIAAVPDEWTFSKSTVSAVFTTQHGEERRPFQVEGPNLYEDDQVEVRSDYPFTSVEMKYSDGQVAGGKAAYLLPMLAGPREELNLEVLYVGQAYGPTGGRSARDRLRSHETLQGIYAEAISKTPDQEVWLLLLGLQAPLSMIQIGPGAPVPATEPTDEEIESDLTRLWTEIPRQQQINLAEASMIRYFAPPFNTIYKRRFPNPAHTTYSGCYELDLNSVGFEMETTGLGLMLYSESRAPEWMHSEVFPLHDAEDRRRMFDFSAG
jgi:hypothetical protein